ncbi:MAG: hypothetical protein AAF587_43195 [Bacteroidota bacterium]
MANLLGLSYVELNIWLFIVVIPGLMTTLLVLNIIHYIGIPFLLKARRMINS